MRETNPEKSAVYASFMLFKKRPNDAENYSSTNRYMHKPNVASADNRQTCDRGWVRSCPRIFVARSWLALRPEVRPAAKAVKKHGTR